MRPAEVIVVNQGRVERAIRYIREAFFPAREWNDLDDLNAQALAWCQGSAAERRCPEDHALSVREALAQEKPRLLPLPKTPHPTDERVPVSVHKTPYVRFDLNDYSIPHTRVHRTLTVLASLDTVRIFDGTELVATHLRSYSRAEQIEHPEHLAALVHAKREARRHRATDRLHQAAPRSPDLLAQLAARGANLGSATAALTRLLDHYGAAELRLAIDQALERGVPHPHAVRQVLEQRRRQRHQPPPTAVVLPNDPRVRDLVVTPHELAHYDPMSEKDPDEHDPSR